MGDNETLTTTTARGGMYVLVRRVSANAIRIGALAILARKLTTAEFGVVALAQMAAALLTVFGSGGIITYVLCDREPDWQDRVNPAFWLNVALTVASCLIAVACVPIVHVVYHDWVVDRVLLLILATYFITQFRMVPEALLQRKLRFRALAVRDTARDFLSAGATVGMALAGMGVWSLVVPNLLVAPLDVFITVGLARFWPHAALGRDQWPRIFKFTKNVMGEQLLTFVGNEADTAVVGKVMGDAVLGVYDLAYQLANLIGRNVSSVLTMVSTPSLATAYERKTGIGAPYRKMMRVLSFVSTPLLLGMFVLAEELVHVVYGGQWTAAVPLLRILIISTLVRSVTSPSGVIFNVVGRPELSMQTALWFVAFYVPALVLTSRTGDIVDVTLCVSACRVAIGLLSLYISLEVIAESKLRVTVELMRPLLAGGIMTGVTWYANHALATVGWPVVVRIFAITALGGAIYFIAMTVISKRAVQEALVVFKALISRKRSAPRATETT